MKFDKKQLKLYAVSDRFGLDEKSLIEKINIALSTGVTMLQLREKNLSFDEFLDEAISVKALTVKHNIPLIINDDVELAKLCGADGVHVGQSDMAVENARQILGGNAIIGATAKTVEQAKKAQQAGADYLGVGAVFGSTTKTEAKSITIAQLCEIVQSVSIPVVAIGGVSLENISKLEGTGIGGVAVVSAIFGDVDTQNAVKELLKIRI